jgi:hypothetical protein
MPKIYTTSGSFKSDITYHFRCEYCGAEYSAKIPLEKEVKLTTLSGPSTNEQFSAAVQNEFKWHEDKAHSLGEKWKFAVNRKIAKCPNCGFLPTYMVNRKQTIFNIIGLLVIGVGAFIPFFFCPRSDG